MKKKMMLLSVLLCSLSSFAQDKYWVFFTDKKNTDFDPYSYFDAKAIQRRIKNHVPLFDSTDMPVNPEYIGAVQLLSDSVGHSTRWFNAVVSWMRPEQKENVERLPFVLSVEKMVSASSLCNAPVWDTAVSVWQKEILYRQIASMQGELFTEKGINGKGVRIAIFDAGFPSVDVNPAFEQIRKEKRILKTWDFVRNKEYVYAYNSHGTCTFSCVAGVMGNKRIGLADGAEFLLARTERSGEPFSEEENWLAAVEWADKNGVDIVNSSLGYTYHRYFPWEMDGKKSLVTRAGNMAARKGILVVNAAGNDGDNKWHVIGAPADADSVLTVGGIDPTGEFHTEFSSFGPTADFRLKPNVSAYGHVIASGRKGLEKTQGTSFSSPLVCGFAACALQTDTNLTVMELFRKIQESSDMYPYFDYAHGYGVPQADYFTEKDYQPIRDAFEVIEQDSAIYIVIREEYMGADRTPREKLFYVRYRDAKGRITNYEVIDADKQYPAYEGTPEHILYIQTDGMIKGQSVEFSYRKCMGRYEKN